MPIAPKTLCLTAKKKKKFRKEEATINNIADPCHATNCYKKNIADISSRNKLLYKNYSRYFCAITLFMI
jgi:hypothetical protein